MLITRFSVQGQTKGRGGGKLGGFPGLQSKKGAKTSLNNRIYGDSKDSFPTCEGISPKITLGLSAFSQKYSKPNNFKEYRFLEDPNY